MGEIVEAASEGGFADGAGLAGRQQLMRECQAALHHVGLERQQAMPREQAVQGADRYAAGGRHRCGRQVRVGNRRIDVALDADEAQFARRFR
ncbi:hypothetical protein G6F65_023314 [Rhizopus arrhizus]|nr:hypothetical protein G6F65_023314 [Rhizopus arrhizus]